MDLLYSKTKKCFCNFFFQQCVDFGKANNISIQTNPNKIYCLSIKWLPEITCVSLCFIFIFQASLECLLLRLRCVCSHPLDTTFHVCIQFCRYFTVCRLTRFWQMKIFAFWFVASSGAAVNHKRLQEKIAEANRAGALTIFWVDADSEIQMHTNQLSASKIEKEYAFWMSELCSSSPSILNHIIRSSIYVFHYKLEIPTV